MHAFAFLFVVGTLSLQAYAAAPRHPADESRIQYPEPVTKQKEDCEGLTYCTIKPKDYPEEKFKEMFKDYKTVQAPQMLVDLANRQGDPNDADNCESVVSFEPLWKVREKRDQPWRYVIQVPEKNIVQRVRLETCSNPGERCFKEFTPNGDYVTFCKQKVNTWEVLVSKGDNETETIKAELPVCCSCHYKQVDLLSRFGASRK